MISREPTTVMGYTITDTVSCRLLPSQITQLRELAVDEGVSLSRFVSELCLTAIQGRENDQAPMLLLDGDGSPTTREDQVAVSPVATLATGVKCGVSSAGARKSRTTRATRIQT
jgi:hypothetical protein